MGIRIAFYIQVLTVLTSLPVLADDIGFERAQQAYRQEHFEEALPLLLESRQGPQANEVNRLLGLTYYHLHQFSEARPLLAGELAAQPNDKESRYALIDVLLALEEPQAAEQLIATMPPQQPEEGRLLYLAGRVEARLGYVANAITNFQQAMVNDPTVLPQVAPELARIYLQQGQRDEAETLLNRAVDGSPNGFEAEYLLRFLPPKTKPTRPWDAIAGYRMQRDSNVVLLPDTEQASGKEDTRHVLTADLSGHRALDKQWNLLGEAHLYQSIYQTHSDLNETRIDVAGSFAWSAPKYGVRLPLEVGQVVVDGNRLRTETRLAPGAYALLPANTTLYGYGVFGKDDYGLSIVDPAEDRSGNFRGGGALALWSSADEKVELRALAERLTYDTEGENWGRDEQRISVTASLRATPQLKVSAALERRTLSFQNLNSVFLLTRDDQVSIHALMVSYQLHEQLQLQGGYARATADSNVDVYAYQRHVESLGVSWNF